GGTAAMRRISSGGAAAEPSRGLVTDNNTYWYIARDRGWLASFNGAVHTEYDWLPYAQPPPATPANGFGGYRQIVEMPWLGPKDFLAIAYHSSALQFTEGIFTFLDWEIPT